MDLEKGNSAEMDAVVDHFRRHVKLRASQHSNSSSHSAFQSTNTVTFRGKRIPPETCPCGKQHWYTECYYLNPNIRPAGWKPTPEVETKVKETLKDATIKARVEKSLKRNRRLQQQATSQGQGHQPTLASSDQDDDKPLGTFTTMFNH
ncbi:hypothetical protein MMC10_008145, partial [Thelotrema lepadinum]|nr:hypothetical protein [Thelotrema lepadinum]